MQGKKITKKTLTCVHDRFKYFYINIVAKCVKFMKKITIFYAFKNALKHKSGFKNK